MAGMTNAAQRDRTVILIAPQAIKDNAEWVGSVGSTPATVDTAPGGVKFNTAKVRLIIGATDIAFGTLKLHESDAASSGFAAFLDLKGASGFASPPGASDGNKVYDVVLDLRKRKRYLRIEAIAGNGTTGTYLTCIVDLSDANSVPNSDSTRNVGELLLVA